MSPIKKSVSFGERTLVLETGEIARQASGAVLTSLGDTTVLVTVVGDKGPGRGLDFFPLTVDYEERTYSAGKIPGGFFKREGRPSEKATLTCRLIDRPLRPTFPSGFRHEVQVIATVLSLDPEVDPDIPALVGASAAISLSGIPFNGPIAGARVGYIDGEYVLNPTLSQLERSQLDLVVAGTETAVLMVESEADELPERVMLDAVLYGHERIQPVIDTIKALAKEAGAPAWDWQAAPEDEALHQSVRAACETSLAEAYLLRDKMERRDRISDVRGQVMEELSGAEDSSWSERGVAGAIGRLEKSIVRARVIGGEARIDGRDARTVRDIRIRTGVLPRTHGSALFTRGETQALVVTTLGTARDAQFVDAIEGERREPFMLHYNFPPFSVGEARRIGSPRRREIGHGRLAKRGVQAVMPAMEEFPYVVRVVSEVTESNGSSSMATVCGSSLSLMDAGVPVKAPVSGIAMGLIKEGDDFVVLSDILGDEDHLGDMDFKVAGTRGGITALQMDIKIDGITRQIMESALDQAKEGRIHILDEMAKVIERPREEMSEYAPRIISFRIHPDKISRRHRKGRSHHPLHHGRDGDHYRHRR